MAASCWCAATGSRHTASAERRWAFRCCTPGPTGSAATSTRPAAAACRCRARLTCSRPTTTACRSTERFPGCSGGRSSRPPPRRTGRASTLGSSGTRRTRRSRCSPSPIVSSTRPCCPQRAIEITLTLTPTGAGPVPVSFGFHPYLRIPGGSRAEAQMTLPVRRRLVHDESMIPTGGGEPFEPGTTALGDSVWDDGFAEHRRAPALPARGPRRRAVARPRARVSLRPGVRPAGQRLRAASSR